MKDNELRSAPPIPPRRLKRKTKPFLDPTAGSSSSSATTPVFLSDRRVRLPPPPPPPRGSLLRGIRETLTRSSSPGNGEKQRMAEAEARQQLSTFGSALCLPIARGNSPKKIASTTRGSPRRRGKDKAKVPRPNEYPPLFFTLQDFQEVMADVESSYSRTLRNMTTFEPTPRPREPSFGGSSDGGSLGEDQVLFRVTTTNVPFERSLGSTWIDTGNDPNHFIFEDYVDRRQRRDPPATRLILFGDDTFDHEGEDEDRSMSTCSRTPSRVRFRIDSDPDEVDDAGKVNEFDSLHNVESLPSDDFPPSQESGDIAKDEFGDVPFDSILDVAPSEDSTNSSSNTDFQTILVMADVEKVPVDSVGRNREDEGLENEAPRRGKDEWAPETVRRSSFLMNMLRDKEEPKEWSACEVVAIHPKGLIPGCRIEGDEVRASAAIEAKSRLLGELSSSFSGIRLKQQRAEYRLGSNDDEGDKERDGSLKIDLKKEKDEEDDAAGMSNVTSNCNLDSVIDSNVVKCNVSEQEPIDERKEEDEKLEDEESRVVTTRNEPRNSSNYDCSQKTDQLTDIKYVDNITVRAEGDIKKQEEEDKVVESAEGENDERENMAEECKKGDNGDDGSSDLTNNNNENKIEFAPRISNVDKCAIVLKCNNNNINNNNNDININNNNNNNDNNAMTPVDVSSDQSKKVLSIIPGSVRSFVKFYEIQGETSIGFNVSENCKEDASGVVLPKITVEEFEKTLDIESSGEKTNSVNIVETAVKPIQVEIENDVKYTIVTRKQIRKDQYNGPAQLDQKSANVNQTTENGFDKSSEPISGETPTTRQCGFLPLVKLCEIDEERREKSGTRSSACHEKTAEMVSQETRNAASRISLGNQGGPAASGDSTNLTSSGTTTKSVPKSSVTTINERYTFYCTV